MNPQQNPVNRKPAELKRPWVSIGVCALLAALVYLPTLEYDLVWDDVDIIVINKSPPLSVFGHSFWHGGTSEAMGKDPFYRPLVNFSLGVDEMVAGHRAWYFHLVSLLLHAGAVALFGLVTWRLFGSFWTTVAVAAPYATHPLFSGCVAYVSGRTDVLAAIGLLVALLGLIRLHRRHDWLAAFEVWGGFAIAVLSKETGVLFALFAPLWLFAAAGRAGLHRRDRAVLVGIAPILGAYLLVRWAVLGSLSGVDVPPSIVGVVLASFASCGRALLSFVFPASGRVFASPGAEAGRFSAWSLVTLAFLALPFALRPLRRARDGALAWFWGLVFLLPVAALSGFGPTGRLLYVPGIGLALLIAFAARELARRRAGAGRVLVVAAIGLAMLFVPLALVRISVWSDGYKLFSRMTREAPGYAAGHFNLAFELKQRNDIEGAVREYVRTIELDSTAALAYSNLGALLQSMNRLDEAERLYRRTLELKPGYALAWNNLAIVQYKRGEIAEAVSSFRRAIALKPDDAGALYNFGRVLERFGHVDSAAVYFERAHRLNPADPRIRASYEQTRPR